jgi:hypothetical protein
LPIPDRPATQTSRGGVAETAWSMRERVWRDSCGRGPWFLKENDAQLKSSPEGGEDETAAGSGRAREIVDSFREAQVAETR